MAEVPADEREALFAKLGADDDGELDGEGASKRAQFLSLLATESAGASAQLGFVGIYGCSFKKKCCSVGNRASFGPDGYGSMPSATHNYIIIE